MLAALLSAVLVSTARLRGQSAPLTLEEAVVVAIASNPDLAAARLGREEARARQDVARERPNPELSFEEQDPELPRDAATLAFPIETAGKRRRRIALAEAQTRSGDAAIARLTMEVRNEVRRAYFGLTAAQRRAGEATELQRLAESARDAARARFEAGDVPRLDAVQADLAAAEAAGEADRARGSLIGARAALNSLLRHPLDEPLVLADAANAADTAPGAGGVPPLDEAVRVALGASAELSALDLGIAEQQAQVELARAEAVPDVTVAGTVTHESPPEFTWGSRAALTVELPIFTRGRSRVRLEEATLARLRAEREAAAARVRGAVYAAAANAEVQRQALLRFRDRILPQAAEVESMAEDAYRSGQTGLASLLQSLQSVHDLRLQAVQAEADYQTALADLEQALGAPLP
jgi:cobalt-zinc-cadmium efflux system outer membrane protein